MKKMAVQEEKKTAETETETETEKELVGDECCIALRTIAPWVHTYLDFGSYGHTSAPFQNHA